VDERSNKVPKPSLDPTERMQRERTRRIGPFKVEVRLGQGGMGTVYLCSDPALDRLVAVKVLRRELVGDKESRDRFLAEARAVARISHPNVVQIYSVEPAGEPFFTMEYVRGGSVADLLREGKPLQIEKACAIVLQAAQGLRALHAASVIHRDITPSNILLDQEGRAKIVDFGLACPAARPADEGVIAGTAPYMAPEQIRGDAVDQRTDIYGLGATLYHMLTGEPPFGRGDSKSVIARKLAGQSPPPVRERRRAVPKSIASVVDRMVKADPAERYATVDEVIRALGRALRRRKLLPYALAGLAAILLASVVVLGLLLAKSSPPLGALAAVRRSDGTLAIDFSEAAARGLSLAQLLKADRVGSGPGPLPDLVPGRGLQFADRIYNVVFPPMRLVEGRILELRVLHGSRVHLCFGFGHPEEAYRSVEVSLRSPREGLVVRVYLAGRVVLEKRWPLVASSGGAWGSGMDAIVRFGENARTVSFTLQRSTDGVKVGAYTVELPLLPAGQRWDEGVLRFKAAPYPRAGYTCIVRGVELEGSLLEAVVGSWVRGSELWRAL